MSKAIFRITVLVLLISVLLLPALPAMAMDEPTSVTLYDILIFQDTLVTNDFLAIVPYDIPFTTTPDENINYTFIFSVVSSNGTEMGTVTAYPRYDRGYGKGIVSFYIASGMIWNEPYIFRVQENPAFYPSPQKWDFTIGTSEYSVDTDQRQGLRAKILDSATELSMEWLTDMLSTGDSGQTVLSTYGELYYTAAIPGLQTMCPALFSTQIETPDYTKRSWSYAFADALRTKYAGTFIADFMTGYAGLFEMDTNSAMDIASMIIYVIVILLSVIKFKASMISAFTNGFVMLELLMLQGFISMIIVGFIAFLSVVVGGVVLLLNK